MIGRFVIISACLSGVGLWLHRRTQRSEYERARAQHEAAARAERLARSLDGVWSEPRPVISDIRGEIVGPGKTAAQTNAGRMVDLPLTPQAQRTIWASAAHAAREGIAKDRDRTARQILQLVAPECDWTQGWQPYGEDPRFRDVYEACQRLIDIAECSFKYARSGDGPALICPGWVHEKPAPTGDLVAGDWVEVMLDDYTVDPSDEGTNADWAWVRIESAPPGAESPVAGTVSMDAPPGQQPNLIRNSAAHGVQPGQHIVVPRRAIYRVVQGK